MNFIDEMLKQLEVSDPVRAETFRKQIEASKKISKNYGCSFVQAMQAFNFVLRNPNVHPGATWTEKAVKELKRRNILPVHTNPV